MSSQDAHKGGSLADMAKDGTKIPGDAGKHNTIPSKANPTTTKSAGNDLGNTSLHTAADNPVGYGPADDDAVTGTGDSLPAAAFTKASGSGGKEGKGPL
ncbi:hypothetical protein F5Y17DRAFT_105924 [Xylariaceae sp. FL0594]|nr:hypothetical protein F5Y17DRAFT_105924 [Xylariaceae sp. FL0594]